MIRNTKHGHAANGRMSPTYLSWVHMKTRCTNPNFNQYHRYGGRGITFDPRWAIFENFLADMGERPHGTSLDRLDNDCSYHKDNCRWATQEKQANNRSSNRNITIAGETRTLAQWGRHYGINPATVLDRQARGWPLKRALKTPKQPVGRPRRRN
ncbi:hypothetical protein ABL849_13690 [Variovorax sp. 375MFSha3.1]|uniref:hypothetical protein n=1 Tax=Variovorax sp. 375MFSha3.1 TaxID=3158364 RepID=UPI003AAB9E33